MADIQAPCALHESAAFMAWRELWADAGDELTWTPEMGPLACDACWAALEAKYAQCNMPQEGLERAREVFRRPGRSLDQAARRRMVYRRVVADLLSLGYEVLAEELEAEANVLYGTPGAPAPLGILTHPAIAAIPRLPDEGREDAEPFLPPAYPAIEPLAVSPIEAEWVEVRTKAEAAIGSALSLGVPDP